MTNSEKKIFIPEKNSDNLVQSYKAAYNKGTYYNCLTLNNKAVIFYRKQWIFNKTNYTRPQFYIYLNETLLKDEEYVLSFDCNINYNNFNSERENELPEFIIYDDSKKWSKLSPAYGYSLGEVVYDNNFEENIYKSKKYWNTDDITNEDSWTSSLKDSSIRIDISKPFKLKNRERIVVLLKPQRDIDNYIKFIEINGYGTPSKPYPNGLLTEDFTKSPNIKIEISNIQIEKGNIPSAYQPSSNAIYDESLEAREATHTYVEQSSSEGWGTASFEGKHYVATSPIEIKNLKLLSQEEKNNTFDNTQAYNGNRLPYTRVSDKIYVPFPFPNRYTNLSGAVDRGGLTICNVNGVGGRAGIGAYFRLETPHYQDGITIDYLVLRLFVSDRRHSIPDQPEFEHNSTIGNEIARCAKSYIDSMKTSINKRYVYGGNIVYTERQNRFRKHDGRITNENGFAIMECDTFAGMVLRGIPYERSPYNPNYMGDANIESELNNRIGKRIINENEVDQNAWSWSSHVSSNWWYRYGAAKGWVHLENHKKSDLIDENSQVFKYNEIKKGDYYIEDNEYYIYLYTYQNLVDNGWVKYSEDNFKKYVKDEWLYVPEHTGYFMRIVGNNENEVEKETVKLSTIKNNYGINILEDETDSIDQGEIKHESGANSERWKRIIGGENYELNSISDPVDHYQNSWDPNDEDADGIDNNKFLTGYRWLMYYTSRDPELPFWAKELRMRIASNLFHSCYVRDVRYAADFSWMFWSVNSPVEYREPDPNDSNNRDKDFVTTKARGCIFKNPKYAKPGDVVFFRTPDTGKWFDSVSHIAIVTEGADENGYITMAEVTGAGNSGGQTLQETNLCYANGTFLRDYYFARPYGWYNPGIWADLWNKDTTQPNKTFVEDKSTWYNEGRIITYAKSHRDKVAGLPNEPTDEFLQQENITRNKWWANWWASNEGISWYANRNDGQKENYAKWAWEEDKAQREADFYSLRYI